MMAEGDGEVKKEAVEAGAGYNEPILDCRQLGNSSYLSRSDRTRNRFLLDAVRQGGDALQPSQVD